jgi:hypothetical protein
MPPQLLPNHNYAKSIAVCRQHATIFVVLLAVFHKQKETMPTQTHSPLLRFLGSTLLFALAAFPVRAHDGPDKVFATAQPPAATVLQVATTGTVEELVVDNRVLNLTARHVVLRLDDGQAVALEGPGLDALSKGARVEAIGRKAGNTLFVTETHVVAGAQGRSATAASGNGTTSVQGTLRVFHADYFAEGHGEYGLVIQGDDGHSTQLNLAVVPDTLRAGMSVIAYGSVAANGFSLDVSSITVLAMPRADIGQPAAAPTTNNVLVIAIKFTDSAAEQFTATAINTQMQTVVAPYYQEVSYGQQSLNITIACFTTPVPAGCTPARVNTNGWLLSTSATPANCNWSTMGSLADAAASAAGYNTSSYSNIYYVLPPALPCGWAGLAYVGFGRAWSNNVNALWVYGHELGHNFGLWHSGYLYCPGQSIGLSCSASEYGDPFDVMGNRYTGHFNSMQKANLGWIPPSAVQTHTSGIATYTLSPLESPGQSTYAVKIPAAADRTYWIEYRQPIGFDQSWSAQFGVPFPNGALFRVASPLAFPCGQGCDTEMLDMSLATGDTDAALLVGHKYVDLTYRIAVQVISATPGPTGLLTLSVSMGGLTTTVLTSSASPSIGGTSVTFTATVAGVAPTGTVAFTSDGVTIAGCSAAAFSGGTINARAATCSTSSLTPGKHSIVATYGGDPNNMASSVISALSQRVSSGGLPPSNNSSH